MNAPPPVGDGSGAAVAAPSAIAGAEFDENDGEDLVPILSSVLQQLVARDDKVYRPMFRILIDQDILIDSTASGCPPDDFHYFPCIEAASNQHTQVPVSYTHLTLPTKA